jgi:hypothetical protein
MLWKKVRYKVGDKGTKQTNHGYQEDKMNHLPFVAHFFSPARRLAPRPFLSGRLRMAAKRISAFSFAVRGGGTNGFSASGAGISPSSGGKSWILHEDFIERRVMSNV